MFILYTIDKSHYIVNSYVLVEEIIPREFTQQSRLQEKTALSEFTKNILLVRKLPFSNLIRML